MKFRRLGASGLKVSELSLGNWLTHGDLIDADAAIGCVHEALDLGISTFDTADVYAMGAAETLLGQALSGVTRESVEILTKVRMPTGSGPNERGLSRKHVLESCDASLRRLGTDHIDVYQAHRYDKNTPLEETVAAFDHLVRSGKVIYVGVSEWTTDQLRAWLDIADQTGAARPISNQPQYSMLWRVPEQKIMPFCREHGISQIVWSPLAQGVLTGKYTPGTAAPPGSRASFAQADEAIGRWLRDDILGAVQRLLPVAAELGITMSQLALAWILTNDNVSSAIVGASRPGQLGENVKALDVVVDADMLKHIDETLTDVVERDPAMTG
jgi:aryl-alcohol dehydrogenase-like predicted oxidoreductase